MLVPVQYNFSNSTIFCPKILSIAKFPFLKKFASSLSYQSLSNHFTKLNNTKNGRYQNIEAGKKGTYFEERTNFAMLLSYFVIFIFSFCESHEKSSEVNKRVLVRTCATGVAATQNLATGACKVGWDQGSCQAPKLIPGHPLA